MCPAPISSQNLQTPNPGTPRPITYIWSFVFLRFRMLAGSPAASAATTLPPPQTNP
jgi:hypothetical protein